MSSKSLTQELEAIQSIIGESPAGIGIAELEARILCHAGSMVHWAVAAQLLKNLGLVPCG